MECLGSATEGAEDASSELSEPVIESRLDKVALAEAMRKGREFRVEFAEEQRRASELSAAELAIRYHQ